ncbi:MAG TPA: ABC transporter permease, partial [Firmicutes bacterium]|nr:ABC transporter permease [Bacillota bacterium]
MINKSSRLHTGKYAAVGRITFLTNLAYFAELLWRTIFMALIIFIFAQLWAVV